MLAQLLSRCMHPLSPSRMLVPDTDLSRGFDIIEEWLIDFDSTMSAKLEAKRLGHGEQEVVLHSLKATVACGNVGKRSLTMAMAEAAILLPTYKLLSVVSLPLLSSRVVPRWTT
jgi:hypothetical protein